MPSRFADVLEAVDELPAEEKEMLVEILKNRLVEERRRQIKGEIEAARREFERGLCRPASTDEIMREISS